MTRHLATACGVVVFGVFMIACGDARPPLHKAGHAPTRRDAGSPPTPDAGASGRDAGSPIHDDEDAGAPGLREDAGRTEDSAVAPELAKRTRAEECRVYTPDRIDFSGYANDFGDDEPDVGLIWRAPETRLYLLSVESNNGEARGLLGEACHGPTISLAYLEAEAGTSYVLVIEAPVETQWVRASMEPACADADKDATCIDEISGVCGVPIHDEDEAEDHSTCLPLHQPGEIDSRCPSTDWKDEHVEGCCRPDGTCGNFDAKLGCHGLAQDLWPKTFYCDERAEPDPPAMFTCDGPVACTSDADCCRVPPDTGSTCIVYPDECTDKPDTCGADGFCQSNN